MSPAAPWDLPQDQQLAALAAADPNLLFRLLETSCLLELSKLTSARLDLAAWAQTVLDVIAQLLPVEAAVLELDAPGLPRLHLSTGRPLPETEVDGGATALRSELTLDGDRVGALVMLPGTGLGDGATGLFDSVARHLDHELAAVVEAERLRRQVAVATATGLAASIDEPCEESHFQALVAALASLPRAVGARLDLESQVLGGPFEIVAGVTGSDRIEDRQVDTRGGSRLRVRVAWTPDASAEDAKVLDDILSTLVASLERGERTRKLKEEVETDPLTGVGNRRRAAGALRAALARAERVGEEVTVLAFDLDHFKRVNDTLGHDVGDAVLAAFAALLFGESRAYDTVARMGGEEFLLVCPGTDFFGARAVAERIIVKVPTACAEILPAGWNQTVSIGAAVYPGAGTHIDALLRRADEALYESKRMGRNRLTLFSGSPAPAAR